MRPAIALLMCCLCLGPAWAEEAPGALAREAGQALAAASQQLDAADSARDRVKALTQTVQAYEAGLKSDDTRLVISPDSEFFRYFGNPTGKTGKDTQTKQ